MKKLGKLLFFAAIAALLTCLLCVALNATQYSGNCGKNGNNVTWSLDTETGVLKIEGKGAMADYSYGGIPWNKYRSNIKTAKVGDGVTSIGRYAFSNCSNFDFTSITIPNSVESIGANAFSNCTRLKSIIFGNNSCLTSVGDWAFSNCNILTSITFGENSQLTNIGQYAFQNCSNLKSITIPDSVTSVGDGAFNACDKLEYSEYDNAKYLGNTENLYLVLIRHKDTSIVSCTINDGTKIIAGGAFSDCSSLTNIEIPSNVESIESGAFNGCSSLTAFNVDDANKNYKSMQGVLFNKDCTTLIAYPVGKDKEIYTIPDSVINIGSSAFNSYSLASITIPSNVASIGSAAFYRSSLTSIIFDDNSQLTNIGNSAFCYSNLTSITIPNSVTSIGMWAFADCSNLTSVTMSDNIINIEEKTFFRCKNLISIIFRENGRLQSIGSYAFCGCENLTSIAIPEGVTSIGDTAFAECSKLGSIILPSSVTQIGSNAFRRNAFGSIIIPDGVTSIESGVFSGCNGLRSVTIPSSVISIGSSAFSGCNGLSNITIPSSVISIGDYAFSSCRNLTSITIPDSVASIGDNAFSYCNKLASITMSNGVATIGNYAFKNCISLKNITIPSSVMSIGKNAFEDCTVLSAVYITDIDAWCQIKFSNIYSNPLYYAHNLYWYGLLVTDATISEGVTSIEDYAFSYCSSLTSITIPSSVTSFGHDALLACTGLTNIFIHETNQNYKSVDGILFTRDGKTLIKYPQGKSEKSYAISDGVTYIGDCAFKDCTALTIVVIPNSVASIGNCAFSNCSNLLLATIPNSVISIGDSTFADCSSLIEIIISNSITSIGDSAFAGCSSLVSVKIPNSVTSIRDSAFADCSSLIDISISEGVVNIGNYTFKNCTALARIIIPSSVKSIGGNYSLKPAFSGCDNLKIITIFSKDVKIVDYNGNAIPKTATIYGYAGSTSETYATKYGRTFIGIIANGKCGENLTWMLDKNWLLTISGIGEMEDYNSKAAWSTFAKYIKSVVITDGVTNIGNYAFQNCSNLMSITIPDSVTSIGSYAFSGCSSLASIEIPDSVASIGMHAFIYCGSLTSITIPSGVTSIGNGAFANCSSLIYNEYDNAKYLGNSENPYVALIEAKSTSIVSCTINHRTKTIAGGAFWGCTNLASITIPDSITSIGSNAFYNCSSLTSIEIPSGVTTIGQSAFSGCSSLMSITIPSNVTNIEDGVFQNCSKLTSIDIPNSVTSIGGGAFCGCNGLTSISIPSSVTIIWQGAFLECSNLTSVSIFSKNVTIVDDAAAITPEAATIYGYSGSTAEAYATKYNRKFVAIDKYNSMNAGATLNENITMNFIGTALTKEDVDGNDFKMTFVMNGSKTSVSPVEKNGKYTFPFAGIAPQCMNDEISYEMTMNGAVVKQGSTSVSGYLKQLIEKKPANMTDAKFKAMSTLVSDMLNYGSAAQAYTGHGTDSLLNENYYDDIVNKYTELESTDKALSGAAPAGAKFTNVGVRFDNVNKVFFRFTADDISKVIITINGVAYGQDKFVKTGDKYTVYSEDILASKFDTVYTAILTYIGTDEKQMMTYSVKSFAYSFQNKRGEDGKLTAEAVLARATYTYGVSAKAYENAE